MDIVNTQGSKSIASTRLDLSIFVGTFLVGLATYFILHFVLRTHQLLVTFFLISLMLSYALAVFSVPRLRIRLDQAGDNAYYLGLLFTLTSMGVALYEFGVGDKNEDARIDAIIGNFGIALASTVAGIFLRVMLHQMRVDPAEIESVSRMELSDAANRVRVELASLSMTFAQTSDEMTQRARDTINKVMELSASGLAEFAANLGSQTDRVLISSSDAHESIVVRAKSVVGDLDLIATSAKDAIDRFRSVKIPTTTLGKRLEDITESIGGLGEKLEAVTVSLASAAENAVRTGAALEAAASGIAHATNSIEARQKDTADRVAAAVAGVAFALEQTGEALSKERLLMADLEAGSRRATEEARAAQEAAVNVLETLTQAVKGLTAVVNTRSTGTQ